MRCDRLHLAGGGRFVKSPSGVSSRGVGVRCFAMVLVALLMAWAPAVGHEVDPAVIAMFRQWSITPPSPSGVFICHGFGCDFRTEIGLAGSDRAQMSAIMASGLPWPGRKGCNRPDRGVV